MKQFLLVTLLLAGCASLQTPQPKPVEVLAPVETVKPHPKVSQPVVVKPTQPVITPVEVSIPVANVTRYVLEYPQSYAKYVPRAEKFYQLALSDSSVLNKATFDYSDATPDSIRDSIRKNLKVRITTYQPSLWKGGKWSRVIGYQSNGVIYHNAYYIGRLTDCQVVNHLVHEYSHTMGYSHGDNSPNGKDNSVPYWIGDRAEELCLQGKI